eukprot:272411-Rhodomonas_salina.1
MAGAPGPPTVTMIMVEIRRRDSDSEEGGKGSRGVEDAQAALLLVLGQYWPDAPTLMELRHSEEGGQGGERGGRAESP